MHKQLFGCLPLTHGPKTLTEAQRILGIVQEYAQAIVAAGEHGDNAGVVRAVCALMRAFAALREWAAVDRLTAAFSQCVEVHITAVRSLMGIDWIDEILPFFMFINNIAVCFKCFVWVGREEVLV